MTDKLFGIDVSKKAVEDDFEESVNHDKKTHNKKLENHPLEKSDEKSETSKKITPTAIHKSTIPISQRDNDIVLDVESDDFDQERRM